MLNSDIETSRLVQAYCRLMRGEWDEYIGPKPDGFDNMPLVGKNLLFGKRKMGRFDFTYPAARVISEIVGKTQLCLLLWRAERNGSDRDWLVWYISERITSDQIEQYGTSQ